MNKWLLILFLVLSFVAQTIMAPGTHPVFSRITPPDIFGGLAIIFGVKSTIKGFQLSLYRNRVLQTALLLICLFFVPILFSYNQQATFLECIILLFLVCLTANLTWTFKNSATTTLFPVLIYALFAASFLGFYDLAASSLGLPRVFPGRTDGEPVSGFRNAGQAGAYFLVFLTILLPLRLSRIYQELSKKHRKMLNVTLLIAIIFLGITAKIASYVGILMGFIFYLIYKRNLRALSMLGIFGALFSLVIYNLETIMPNTYYRIQLKYRTRVVDNVSGENTSDFLVENYLSAFESFVDRPLIGSGIGAFEGKYSSHEVHSTYLKMLGETGVLGSIGYFLFMLLFLQIFWVVKKYRNTNNYAHYLTIMLPFVLGCIISWAYTYHLRKREFWILIAVILIASYNVSRREKLNSVLNA